MGKVLKHKRFNQLLDTDLVERLNPESPVFRTATRSASSLAKFGISIEQYEAMIEAQEGLCAICRKVCSMKSMLSIDHDHITGHVRGLLCGKCNTGIGLLGDRVDGLRRALAYLIAAENK